MWTRTSTCRQNGYGFTAPYPYEVTAGGAAAGELLGGVTGSRRILVSSEETRGGKGLMLRVAKPGKVTKAGKLTKAVNN